MSTRRSLASSKDAKGNTSSSQKRAGIGKFNFNAEKSVLKVRMSLENKVSRKLKIRSERFRQFLAEFFGRFDIDLNLKI